MSWTKTGHVLICDPVQLCSLLQIERVRDPLYFTFLKQWNVQSSFQPIQNDIIKSFRAEYSLRPVKTAFHGELVSINETFISYDRQVAHTRINDLFAFSM